MASCTLPVGTSPGRLALFYNHTTAHLRHKISWHLLAGTNLTDVPNLRTEAQRLVDYLYLALTNSFEITDWAIEVPNGGIFYEEPLPTPRVGTKPSATGAADWYSTTLAFVGTGLAPAPGICHGKSISRLFVGDSYLFGPGAKRLDASLSPALADFIHHGLNQSLYVPCDVYGQQAEILFSCPLQYNAAAQRKWGT